MNDATPPAIVPRHIAIIMDGNGRWAERRGLPRLEGHRRGAEMVREIVRSAGKWGVGYLTLFSFSTENWGRPPEEVSGLMQILKTYIKSELPELHTNRVRMNFIGQLDDLPAEVRDVMEESRRFTATNTGLVLTLALSYGGRQEILAAVRALAQEAQAGRLNPRDIDAAHFAKRLFTAEMPDPELLIRTSGENRISNFLLWQIAYSEIYITETCWPDFTPDELIKAIREYNRRERRFGLTSAQMTGK